MISYHVYIDGFCIHVCESKEQAKAFLDMMGKEGYGGYILKQNEETNESEIIN